MPNTTATTHLDGATFGVEFEVYLPEGASHADAAAAVSQRLGGESRCYPESYNHRTGSHWKVVTDGSLGDIRRGAEFVSPVLRGEDGLRQIERVCEALTDFGCTVNRKCGFHVHVGARHESLAFYKNLVKLYGMFEPVIDVMMPVSRRAGHNMFCRPMTAASPAAIDRASTMDALVMAATNHCGVNERRYFKVNLAAHHRHGTVEFRQHSATTDATKARRWVELCLRMVATAKRADVAVAPTETRNQARPGSKSHMIGEMMLRPNGATRTEICAATGWPSVSMPQQARACGLQFTTERTGREVRYFAVRNTGAATAEITINGFANMIGATDEERRYIERRTQDLGGNIAWAA